MLTRGRPILRTSYGGLRFDPLTIAEGAVLLAGALVLLWHRVGRWLLARSVAGRRMLGFTALEQHVLTAYSRRRSDLGLSGCDCMEQTGSAGR